MTALHPSTLTSLVPGATARGSSSSSSSTSANAPPELAVRFLEYSNASPTPFHAVQTSSSMLESAGFVRLKESDLWDGQLERGGRYFFTRNQSALVAFAVGAKFQPGEGGVHIVGGHTDSPNFHLKPKSSKKDKDGYLQVGVEAYGGGIWHTWFDRDLTLAGRVIVEEASGSFVGRLVHVKRPLLRIPTLAIHLNRTVNDGFKFNLEEQTVPVLGLAVQDALNAPSSSSSSSSAVGAPQMKDKHPSVLLELLAQELGVKPEHIQDFELSLADTQPAAVGGIANEFIHAPRLDNQMTCFCATTAIINAHASSAALAQSSSIRAMALFDNEEVGSVSTHGAESNMVPSLIRRLATLHLQSSSSSSSDAAAGEKQSSYDRSLARSFLISSDMAHAVHPNYAKMHDDEHRPALNGGPVIKTNVKQRYASTGPTTFLLRRIAAKCNVPLQEFVVRNDMPCGSTIGPMMSKIGLRTVDIGECRPPSLHRIVHTR